MFNTDHGAIRRALPLRATLAGLGLLLALPAGAEVLNVSYIATGQSHFLNFFQWQNYPEYACGQCSYSASSSAAISGGSGTTLMPHAWPAPAQSTLPKPPTLEQSVATPQDEIDGNDVHHHYDADFYRQAAVKFSLLDQRVTSDTFDGGSAAAMTTFHITARNSAATTRDYFVEFKVPQKARSFAASYSLVPGSNGGTYVYQRQDYAFSRSLVEVVVDGLPVWSQTSTYNFPEDFSGYAWNYLGVDWGSSETDRVVLYLGKLAPAASLKIDYSVQTSAIADVDQCGSSWESYVYTEQSHHCYRLKEERLLPGKFNGWTLSSMDFRVFTKELP